MAYYTKTGNTQKTAEQIAQGAKTPNTTTEVKPVTDITPQEAAQADAIAFGSPAYFSLMSGPVLTLLTEMYFIKDKFAGKPMTAFATGGGSQTKTVENIETILKVFNPKLTPGVAVSSDLTETEQEQARKLGAALAKATEN
ncbi:MAG: flavodoxin [Candidatus Bathyarchaeota archaeon]|nr:flavodoxin [Candidatus Bathyarchaeota archaeon]